MTKALFLTVMGGFQILLSLKLQTVNGFFAGWVVFVLGLAELCALQPKKKRRSR